MDAGVAVVTGNTGQDADLEMRILVLGEFVAAAEREAAWLAHQEAPFADRIAAERAAGRMRRDLDDLEAQMWARVFGFTSIG